MKCQHCGAENQEQAKFCSECGEKLLVCDTAEPPTLANNNDAVATDSGAKERKPSSILKLLGKVISGAAVLYFISCVLFFCMGITRAPRDLWQNGIMADTRWEVENELLAAGFPAEISVQSTTKVHDNYKELEFDYRLVAPWNFSNDSDISSILFLGFDNWKGAFVYDIYETWKISVDDVDLGTVETTTTVLAQPEWNGEHLYKNYVDMELSSDLYALGAEYEQSAKQAALEEKFQLQDFYLVYVDDWYAGKYEQFVVEYQWTNTANYARSPFTDVAISAYQNGVELKTDYSYERPYDALTNIAAGETIINSMAFKLNDPYSDVEVHVKNYLAEISGDSAEISCTVTLNNGNSDQNNAMQGLLPISAPLELYFSSGAGAWGTSLILYSDGSFEGSYMNSDMGVQGEGYPYGTSYICTFNGYFDNIIQINDYTYALTLNEINRTNEQEGEWIEEGIRYVTADPYGLEQGKEFLFYTPDAPIENLPADFLEWWPLRYTQEGAVVEKLSYYGLYNEEMGYGFFS